MADRSACPEHGVCWPAGSDRLRRCASNLIQLRRFSAAAQSWQEGQADKPSGSSGTGRRSKAAPTSARVASRRWARELIPRIRSSSLSRSALDTWGGHHGMGGGAGRWLSEEPLPAAPLCLDRQLKWPQPAPLAHQFPPHRVSPRHPQLPTLSHARVRQLQGRCNTACRPRPRRQL